MQDTCHICPVQAGPASDTAQGYGVVLPPRGASGKTPVQSRDDKNSTDLQPQALQSTTSHDFISTPSLGRRITQPDPPSSTASVLDRVKASCHLTEAVNATNNRSNRMIWNLYRTALGLAGIVFRWSCMVVRLLDRRASSPCPRHSSRAEATFRRRRPALPIFLLCQQLQRCFLAALAVPFNGFAVHSHIVDG